MKKISADPLKDLNCAEYTKKKKKSLSHFYFFRNVHFPTFLLLALQDNLFTAKTQKMSEKENGLYDGKKRGGGGREEEEELTQELRDN